MRRPIIFQAAIPAICYLGHMCYEQRRASKMLDLARMCSLAGRWAAESGLGMQRFSHNTEERAVG